jgi:hypothetical protein
MTADSLLADLTSRDAQRIWAASHAVAKVGDGALLRALSAEVGAIEAATDGVELGGALRPNRVALEFAIKKLRHVATSDDCLCTLYPTYDLFDPAAQADAGHIAILAEETIPYASIYSCRCATCGADYTAEERDYHYMWWEWTAVG